jgi:hypothetical protein
MVLQSIVSVVYPAQLILFYQICVVFSGIDILNGPMFYEMAFSFQDSLPLNDVFD